MARIFHFETCHVMTVFMFSAKLHHDHFRDFVKRCQSHLCPILSRVSAAWFGQSLMERSEALEFLNIQLLQMNERISATCEKISIRYSSSTQAFRSVLVAWSIDASLFFSPGLDLFLNGLLKSEGSRGSKAVFVKVTSANFLVSLLHKRVLNDVSVKPWMWTISTDIAGQKTESNSRRPTAQIKG